MEAGRDRHQARPASGHFKRQCLCCLDGIVVANELLDDVAVFCVLQLYDNKLITLVYGYDVAELATDGKLTLQRTQVQ